jgi:mRNA guanylyltransferase
MTSFSMHDELPQIPGKPISDHILMDRRRDVAQLLGRNKLAFPGAQPISFTRRHLDALCIEDYWLCEKTDGIRCLLYCTQNDAGSELHYLIDRKNDYYEVADLHLPHHEDRTFHRFHVDTLLDGELVLDRVAGGRKVLRYLVFDCLALDGEALTQKTFDKRIGRFQAYVQSPLNKFYKQFPEDASRFDFEIVMKKLDKPYGLDEFFDHTLKNLPHGNDGLIFTAKNAFYTSGTDEKILKWKPANENTIDFRIHLGEFPLFDFEDGLGPQEDYEAKPVIHLLCNAGNGVHADFGELYLTDEDWEIMMGLNQELDGRIVECYIDSQQRWRFKREPNGAPRFRDDKNEANHTSTVDKVLESISDGVSERDLRSATDQIRREWKRRHPEESMRPPNGH